MMNADVAIHVEVLMMDDLLRVTELERGIDDG